MRWFASFAIVVLTACGDEGASRSEHKNADAPQQAAPASSAPPKDVGGGARPGAQATASPPPATEPEAADAKSGGGGKRRVRLAVVGGLGGSLTQAQVEQTIEGAREGLQACYGNVEARLEVALQIGATGEVGDAAIMRSEPSAPKPIECAKLRLEKLKFPAPRSSVKLDLQIYLEPQG
jgi:hypothetical protein